MNVYVESLPYGLMVYWDEEKEAARYYVHLLIGDKQRYVEFERGRYVAKFKNEIFKEIEVVEKDRNVKYHSFMNLGKIDLNYDSDGNSYNSGKNYYIYVEAEDKNGNIISKSKSIVGVVYI